jgi:hypothetical protein
MVSMSPPSRRAKCLAGRWIFAVKLVAAQRHSQQAWQQTTGVIAVAGVGSKQSGEASSPEQEVRENEGYGWVLADESSQLAAIRGISV